MKLEYTYIFLKWNHVRGKMFTRIKSFLLKRVIAMQHKELFSPS